MDLLVHGELACLSEGSIASWAVAFEWFLLCVDVGVLLQVLCKSKGLEAEHTYMLFNHGVRRDVSSQREAGGVGLAATCHFTFIWSFHCTWSSLGLFLNVMIY